MAFFILCHCFFTATPFYPRREFVLLSRLSPYASSCKDSAQLLVDLLLPFLHDKRTSFDSRTAILVSLRHILPLLPNPARCLSVLARLFLTLVAPDNRTALSNVWQEIGKLPIPSDMLVLHNGGISSASSEPAASAASSSSSSSPAVYLSTVADVLTELNAMDDSKLEEPDFTKRSRAFIWLASFAAGAAPFSENSIIAERDTMYGGAHVRLPPVWKFREWAPVVFRCVRCFSSLLTLHLSISPKFDFCFCCSLTACCTQWRMRNSLCEATHCTC